MQRLKMEQLEDCLMPRSFKRQLEQQTDYISVVELARILGTNTFKVEQKLYELNDRRFFHK